MTVSVLERDDAYFDALPLNVIHIRHHGNTRLHRHNFTEIVVVLAGAGVHISPGGEHAIGAGDAFVLHEGQAHGYHGAQSLELVNILVVMDELALSMRDIEEIPGFSTLMLGPSPAAGVFESRLRLSTERLARVTDCINVMLVEQKTRPAGWKFAMVAQFAQLVTELCRAHSERDNPAMRSLTRLAGVIGYIHSHYGQDLTLDDLATVAGLSRRTLTREFRSALGISPIDYLIRERVTRAMDLLRSSDLSVTEVAFLVGFQDSSYFTRQFRTHMGFAPRQARKLSVL